MELVPNNLVHSFYEYKFIIIWIMNDMSHNKKIWMLFTARPSWQSCLSLKTTAKFHATIIDFAFVQIIKEKNCHRNVLVEMILLYFRHAMILSYDFFKKVNILALCILYSLPHRSGSFVHLYWGYISVFHALF